MRRAALVAAMLALAGCGDDRARVSSSIFSCNPASPTADYDCGEGYKCYAAAQAIGGSFCAARCDPANPRSCKGGICTVGGACIQLCHVGAPDQCGGPSSPLLCARRPNAMPTDAFDGLCMPFSLLCSTNADCTSPIYNQCATPSVGFIRSPEPTQGLVCLQGGCVKAEAACAPGSSCVARIVAQLNISVPDVCTPNCVYAATPGDGGVVDECLFGFTCLRNVFPQTEERACVPGFPGLYCNDSLGCVVGTCESWGDVAPEMTNFRTCDPACTSDSDCLIWDRPGTPVAFSKLSCRAGRCRSQQSFLFGELCFDQSQPCRLDPKAVCRVPTELAVATPDGGAPPCQLLSISANSTSMAAATICVRTCSSDDDCATLNQNTHVRHLCLLGICLPEAPGLSPCISQKECLPGLSCMQPADLPYPVCTAPCTSPADCSANVALGSAFTCAKNGLCEPKMQSGCAPAQANNADYCISGKIAADGRCVSPAGWPCAIDAECDNSHCGSDGRCK